MTQIWDFSQNMNLMHPHHMGAEALAEAEAIDTIEYNIENYDWYLQCQKIVRRSYEYPYRWYYLTFKPFNEGYEPLSKDIDKIFNKLRSGAEFMLVTREIDATKIHYNVIVATHIDLSRLHNRVSHHRWKMYCDELDTTDYRMNVFKYMCKEARRRPFLKFIDYKYLLPKDFDGSF